MEQVLRLVADYQWWIYGVLGLVLLFYLRRAIVARRESVRSIFRLEQEQAGARYGRSVGLAAFVLLLMGAVFGLTNFLLPSMSQPPEPVTTPTAGPLVAPTLTSTAMPPTSRTSTGTADATPGRTISTTRRCLTTASLTVSSKIP